MEPGTKLNSTTPLNLGKSLCPLWKLTYYSGLTFDWSSRRIQANQNKLLSFIRSIFVFMALILYFFIVSLSVAQIFQSSIDPGNKFYGIVFDIIFFGEKPMILFVWFYFLVYRTNIKAFLSDWCRMEEEYIKGIDSARIKRTCTIVYVLYYTYGLLQLCFVVFAAFTAPDIREDALSNYYLKNLLLSTPYMIFARAHMCFGSVVHTVFYSLMDIVPTLVYYHASKFVEALTWEVRELHNGGSSSSNVSKNVYNLSSRLETLIVMLRRADQLFGGIVILSQGTLFFLICCTVYSLFVLPSVNDMGILPKILECLILYPPRLLFTVSFMCKLHGSSDDLISEVAHFAHKREYIADKEERRIVGAFLSRLKQAKLSAHPARFYKMKPSVLLTLLSLIVTYTIILMQTNAGGSQKFVPRVV